MRKAIATLGVLTVAFSAVGRSQSPSLDDVIARLGAYVAQCEMSLSDVEAEESYQQQYTYRMNATEFIRKRTIQSDFAFLRIPGEQLWLGIRDIRSVDGKPVADSTSRLLAILGMGQADALREAARIATENSRYNLGDIPRTINVPTAALDLLHPRYRARFVFKKEGEETIVGHRAWRLAFTEVTRPSIIKTKEGDDQLTRGIAWVEPMSGQILKTQLDLGGDSVAAFVNTRLDVSYQLDQKVGCFVPQEMYESYYRPGGRYVRVQITAHATYRNFRRFESSGRLVTEQP